jgi:hypothetical protein
MQINLETTLNLYKKYAKDLNRIKEAERKFCNRHVNLMLFNQHYYRMILSFLSKYLQIQHFYPQMSDIEVEMLYLLIRKNKPQHIVEMSPCHGWSTSWMLNAVNDNKLGKVFSYDVVDWSKKYLPESLKRNWIFVQGDVRTTIKDIEEIDFLFVDSEHTKKLAEWYIKNIFPHLKNGTVVAIHDVYNNYGISLEGIEVLKWLTKNNIEYFTPSPIYDEEIHSEIEKIKTALKLEDKIITHTVENPTIFFTIGDKN